MLNTIPFLVGEAKKTPRGCEGLLVIARLDGLMEERDKGVVVWTKGLSANVEGNPLKTYIHGLLLSMLIIFGIITFMSQAFLY